MTDAEDTDDWSEGDATGSDGGVRRDSMSLRESVRAWKEVFGLADDGEEPPSETAPRPHRTEEGVEVTTLSLDGRLGSLTERLGLSGGDDSDSE